MLETQQEIFDYICKANRKIAQISSEANDLLEKSGCTCDIQSYVDDILDINSSLYIISKDWENIDPTFGYENFLISLFSHPEEEVLEILDAYIDRYSMTDSSFIVSPLFPSHIMGPGCCGGFVSDLYYNKTESDARFYPRYSNPEGYVKTSELDEFLTEEDLLEYGFLTEETDPTVPEHVKGITEEDIENWNSNTGFEEVDPTVPAHVKAITEEDIENWNSGIDEEVDPTVPAHVKAITNTNVSNWNTAYGVTSTLTPLFISRSAFTSLSFNRMGGYIVASAAQPLTGTNITLSIGGDVKFSRSVIYHSHTSRPVFSGLGINVLEMGNYLPDRVNEILLFYNGGGRVIVFYTFPGTETELSPVRFRYVDDADMFANQANQLEGYLYYSAGSDSYYDYLGTTNGDISDYNNLNRHPTIDEVLSAGNVTTHEIIHADGTTDQSSATIGQVKELILSSEFEDTDLGLISGGVVQWSEVGYEYNVSTAVIKYNGDLYTIPYDDVVLDPSDVTLDRLDIIYVNSTGFYKETGIPSATPVKPQVPNPETDIELTVIFVGADTDFPENVDTSIIFNENLEWVVSSISTTGTYNPNSTSTPFIGTKSLELSDLHTGNFELRFVRDSDFLVSDYDSLSFQLHLKESFPTQSNIKVRFYNSANQIVSKTLSASFQRITTGQYQYVSFPISEFAFTATTARSMRIYWTPGSSTITNDGFFLDLIRLQGGVTTPPTEDPIELGFGLSFDADGKIELGRFDGSENVIDVTESKGEGLSIIGNSSSKDISTSISASNSTNDSASIIVESTTDGDASVTIGISSPTERAYIGAEKTVGGYSLRVVDEINQKGIENDDDYSSNWTDHSLVTKKWVQNNFSPIGISPGRISAELTIISSTSGEITASWIDYESDTESVTDYPLSFNGGGLPATDNFRYDLIQGLDDGTVDVKEGIEGDEDSVAIPSTDVGKVLLSIVLWNSLGEGVIIPPVDDLGDWSLIRLSTQAAPNTTGKYAKVWDGPLLPSNNYGIELSYQEPINPNSPFDGSGQRNLKVSFTCDESANIVSSTVQIETDGGVEGEFILYQLSGNRAAIYHKSNHYWGRIEYRILFHNSSVDLLDFPNGSVYGAEPAFIDSYPSIIPTVGAPTVESVQDEFTWVSGPQEFTLSEAIIGRPIVFLNSAHLRESKWTLTDGVITITEALTFESTVVVYYYKTSVVGAYPEVGLSSQNFFQLVTNGTIYARGGNVPQEVSGTGGDIVLTFRRDTIYGSPSAPLNGPISEDFTGDFTPNKGAEAILWYYGELLILDSKYKRIHGTYEMAELNKIVFRYYEDDYITYQIFQEL